MTRTAPSATTLPLANVAQEMRPGASLPLLCRLGQSRWFALSNGRGHTRSFHQMSISNFDYKRTTDAPSVNLSVDNGAYKEFAVTLDDGTPWQVITPPARCENVYLGKRGDYKQGRFTETPQKSSLRVDIVQDEGEGSAVAPFFDYLKRVEESVLSSLFMQPEMNEYRDAARAGTDGDDEAALANFINAAMSPLKHTDGVLRVKTKAFPQVKFGVQVIEEELDFFAAARSFYDLDVGESDDGDEYLVSPCESDATVRDGATLSLIIRPRVWAFNNNFGISYLFDTRRICRVRGGGAAEAARSGGMKPHKIVKAGPTEWGASLLQMKTRAGSPFKLSVSGTITYHDFNSPAGAYGDGDGDDFRSQKWSACIEEVYDHDAQSSFREIDDLTTQLVDFIYDDAELLAGLKETWEHMIVEEFGGAPSDGEFQDAVKEEISAYFGNSIGDGGADPTAPRRLWVRARRDGDAPVAVEGPAAHAVGATAAAIPVGSKATFDVKPFAYVMSDGSRAGVTFDFGGTVSLEDAGVDD